MISITKLKSIISDNKYTALDIKNDFHSHPDGWNCVLKDSENSFDQMSDKEQNEFKNQLFEAADNYAPSPKMEKRYTGNTERFNGMRTEKGFVSDVEKEAREMGISRGDLLQICFYNAKKSEAIFFHVCKKCNHKNWADEAGMIAKFYKTKDGECDNCGATGLEYSDFP